MKREKTSSRKGAKPGKKTERKKGPAKIEQKALRESEKRFRTLAENAPDIIVRFDKQLRHLYANPPVEKVTGTPREKFIGKTNEELGMPGEIGALWNRTLKKVFRTGDAGHIEFNFPTPDGMRFFDLRAVPELVHGGAIESVLIIMRDITGRKRAEETLTHQREMLQRLFDYIPVFLVMWDPRLQRFTLNRHAEEVLGWTTADANEGDFMSKVYPDAAYRAEVAAYMQSLQTGWREWDVTTKDGRRVPSDWANIRLTDDTMIGIGVDLRERKRAEQVLRESQKDLNRAQAVAHTGSWRLDVRRNELLWSDETHRIFGIPKGTPMTYETFLAAVHPEDRKYVDQQWQAGLRGKPYDIEHRIVVDGQVKWVRERAELEFDHEGTLLGGFGTAQDITERKLAEEALRKLKDQLEVRVQERTAELKGVVETLQEEMAERKQAQIARKESEARYRSLFEDSRDPVYIVRRDGTFLDFNQAMVDLFGYSREELVHLNIRDLYENADERPRFQRHIERRGWLRDYEIRWRRKNGRMRDCLLTASLWRAEDGTILGYQGIIRDITRQRRYQRALQNYAERLRALSQKLLDAQEKERRLVARDLHDSIGGSLSAIKFSLARKLEHMNQGGSSGEVLLENIISMVQRTIDENRRIMTELRPSLLDDLGVVETIDWFCGEFEGVYPNVRIEKQVEIEESEIPEHLKIVIFRILQEALNNVAKHSKADFAHVYVGNTDGSIEIAIKDNGQGLDPRTVITQGEDRSMGLSSMRERAELFGGTFSLESKLGEGTTVRAKWEIKNN